MYKDIVFLDDVQVNFLRDVRSFLAEWENDASFIEVKTSGSTGEPKLIKLDKEKALASAKATGEFFNLQEGEALLLNLSPEYIAGKMMLIRAVAHSMKIVVAPLNSNPLKGLDEFPCEIKFGAFVPMQVEEIMKDAKSAKLYNQIEKVIIGGAPIHFHLEHRIQECSNENYASFGMTETITHFALRNINEGEEFYRCLSGVQISTDERGCLLLERSPATNEPLRTNDLIEQLDDERFIWKGRIDNTINSGGVKIHPETVEKEIEYMIPPVRFYITARAHEQLGEEVVLVMESSPLPESEEISLLNQIIRSLPNYHSPRTVIYQNEFKETATGKILREKF